MIASEVLRTSASRFDMAGQKLPSFVDSTKKTISAGLVKRLHQYAERELVAHGFGALAQNAEVKVYTLDGDDKPSDRIYCVRWHRPEGGYVEMVGIHTNSGWPTLDFGFAIGFESRT